MEKNITLYEKAIEKEKQIESLISRLRDGESLMRHMHDADDVSMCFDTIAIPYITQAIKDLRHEIVMCAIEYAKAELKEVRQAAVEEAKRVLADCQKEEAPPEIEKHKPVPVENTYLKARCNECGAYVSNKPYLNYINNDIVKYYECGKCGKDYDNLDEISFKIVEIK